MEVEPAGPQFAAAAREHAEVALGNTVSIEDSPFKIHIKTGIYWLCFRSLYYHLNLQVNDMIAILFSCSGL